jgi:hypothetical protein
MNLFQFGNEFGNEKSGWEEQDKNLVCEMLESVPWAQLAEPKMHLPLELHFVASANTPVACLFPVLHAIKLGVLNITLKLPSLRPHDAQSAQVRNQISDIFKIVKFKISNLNLKLTHDFYQGTPNSKFIVFGTNETIALFKSEFGEKRVLGFGDTENYIFSSEKNLSTHIPALTAFGGRGCLTPLGIVSNTAFLQTQVFGTEFHAAFATRLQRPSSRFHVAHDFAAQLQGLCSVQHDDLNRFIYFSDACFVLNLSSLDADIFQKLRFNPKLFGQGNIFICTKAQFNFYTHDSRTGYGTLEKNWKPLFHDEHQGKDWTVWLKNFL